MIFKTSGVSARQLVSDLQYLDLKARIKGISWCPLGMHLAVWTKNGELIILDQNGAVLARWNAHRGEILSADWNSTGSLLASTGLDGISKIWDLRTRVMRAALHQSEGWVQFLQWSKKSELLISACCNLVRVWNEDGLLIDELKCHDWPLYGLTWNPTDRMSFATSSIDGVRIWSLGSAAPECNFPFFGYSEQLQFNKSGTALAFVKENSSIHVCRINTEKMLALSGLSSSINLMDWSWGGQWLAFGGYSEAYLWKYNEFDNRPANPISLGGVIGFLTQLKFHPYLQLLAGGDEDGFVHIWRSDIQEKQKLVSAFSVKETVVSLNWNPLQPVLTVASSSGQIVFWFQNRECI